MSVEEETRKHEELGTLYTTLQYFPWSGLRKTSRHRYPTLRIWPKFRSLEVELPEKWEDVAWRPIASYARHHYKSALAMSGMYCTAALRELHWGWGAENARDVVDEVHVFNEGARPDRWVRRKEEAEGEEEPQEEIAMMMFDLKDFFVSVYLFSMPFH